MGKSQIMISLGKPKWMPMWMFKLRMRRKWVDHPMSKLNPEDFVIPSPTFLTGNTFDPSDIAPGNHTVAPRPWPKGE